MTGRSHSLPRWRERSQSLGRNSSPRRDYRRDYNTVSRSSKPKDDYVRWQRAELDKEIEKMDALLQELHCVTPLVPGTLQKSKKHFRKELASRPPNDTSFSDEEERLRLSNTLQSKEIFSVGLQDFHPRDVNINVSGSKVRIHAQNNDTHYGRKEYKRTIYAPGMDLSMLKGTLDESGTLTLVAPTLRGQGHGSRSRSRTHERSIAVTPNYGTQVHAKSISDKPRYRSMSATRELEYDTGFEDVPYEDEGPVRPYSSMSYRSPSRQQSYIRSSSVSRKLDYDDGPRTQGLYRGRSPSPLRHIERQRTPRFRSKSATREIDHTQRNERFHRSITPGPYSPVRGRGPSTPGPYSPVRGREPSTPGPYSPVRGREPSTTGPYSPMRERDTAIRGRTPEPITPVRGRSTERGRTLERYRPSPTSSYEHDKLVREQHSQPPKQFGSTLDRTRFRSASTSRDGEYHDYNQNYDNIDGSPLGGRKFSPRVIIRRDSEEDLFNGNSLLKRSLSNRSRPTTPSSGRHVSLATPSPMTLSPPAYNSINSARVSPEPPHHRSTTPAQGTNDDVQVFVGKNVCALMEVGRHYYPEDMIVKNIIQENRFVVEIRPRNKKSIIPDLKREFNWPIPVDPNSISAVVKGGLLKITALPM